MVSTLLRMPPVTSVVCEPLVWWRISCMLFDEMRGTGWAFSSMRGSPV